MKILQPMAALSLIWSKRNLAIVALLALLSFYVGQTSGRERPVSHASASWVPGGGAAKTGEGIVYFSTNNGLTWKNESKGLPAHISIGLGGIAVSGNRLALVS